MKQLKMPVLFVFIFSMILSACMGRTVASQPAVTAAQETVFTATLARVTPTGTKITVYPPEIHLILPSGLTIDEYALEDAPSTEPLIFVPLQWTQKEILDKHRHEMGEAFPDNSFFDDGHFSMSVNWNNQRLVARETYTATHTQSAKGVVDILLGDKKIYTIQVGDGGPIHSLRGLWTYNQHWILEVATITTIYNEMTNESVSVATGQIIEDGELLNKRYSCQEMFGFQLMGGKPFYFFKTGDKISISYDGQVTSLEYDFVPHYNCCSGAELNPRSTRNMVSFFAQRNGTWYYVEIGIFE